MAFHGTCIHAWRLARMIVHTCKKKGGREREWRRQWGKWTYSHYLVRCREKASVIVRVEEEVGWRRLQDELLSFKLRHMEGLQALSGLMSHHGRGSKPCPFCEEDSLADSVLNHVLARLGAEVGVVGACDGDWVMSTWRNWTQTSWPSSVTYSSLLSPWIIGVLCQVYVLYYLMLLVGFSNELLTFEL